MTPNDIIASRKTKDKAIDEKICTSTTSATNFIMVIWKKVRGGVRWAGSKQPISPI